MVQIFFWSVMVYGISNILVYGSIFDAPRNFINRMADNPKSFLNGFWVFLSDMLKCMMCTPTWVGFFIGGFIFSPTFEVIGLSQYFSWFLDGMFASGIVWIINSIVEWFEDRSN